MAQPASRLDLSRVVQCVQSPLDLNILTHTVRSWGKDSPNRCAPSLDRPLCVTDLLIVKNLKTKCEGLSPALFLFSIAGNVTYVLSILVASMDLDHIAANAGWIAGEHSCPAAITSRCKLFGRELFDCLFRRFCKSSATVFRYSCSSCRRSGVGPILLLPDIQSLPYTCYWAVESPDRAPYCVATSA